jgi:YHS domain-containing protein
VIAWLSFIDPEVVVMTRRILAVALFAFIAAASITVFAQGKKEPERTQDPVCGLKVEKVPELSHNHKGETYYFCSRADMDKFKKEPDKYAKKK